VIYLLYGGDEVARDEFLQRQLVARLRALPGGEFNLDRFDGRTAPLAEIIACCQATPFLADKRMVIVAHLGARSRGRAPRDGASTEAAMPPPARSGRRSRDPGGDEELAAFWAFLPTLPPSTHLVLLEERPLPLPPLPPGLLFTREFPAPKPWEVPGWVTRRARAHQLRLGRGVADLLVSLVGPDLRRLDNELAKLALYCGARPAQEDDVRRLVAPGEASVFTLLDAVAEGRAGAALAALRRLLQQGQPVEALVPQLAALVRRLLIASELQAEGRSLAAEGAAYGLSTSPRALDKLARQAARFQPADFERLYERLLACDRAIKTGECPAEVAVELLVAELAGVAAEAPATAR
jgi:DNA polymerase-3 subunit delta